MHPGRTLHKGESSLSAHSLFLSFSFLSFPLPPSRIPGKWLTHRAHGALERRPPEGFIPV